MTRQDKITGVVLGLYVAGAFLTAAYHTNHRQVCDVLPVTEYRKTEGQLCPPDSILAGFVWPFYWLARASIWITR